jgi:uncharacterized protein (DUF488 family)
VPALFTIGYEDDPTPSDLIARLAGAGVERLVDVRALPRSRRRGFSRTALAEALAGAGIAYEHRRALGNPQPHRDEYRHGDLAAGRRGYLAHLRGPAAAEVDALAASLDGPPTAVMCVERDPARCHRRELAAEIVARRPGVDVVDL